MRHQMRSIALLMRSVAASSSKAVSGLLSRPDDDELSAVVSLEPPREGEDPWFGPAFETHVIPCRVVEFCARVDRQDVGYGFEARRGRQARRDERVSGRGLGARPAIRCRGCGAGPGVGLRRSSAVARVGSTTQGTVLASRSSRMAAAFEGVGGVPVGRVGAIGQVLQPEELAGGQERLVERWFSDSGTSHRGFDGLSSEPVDEVVGGGVVRDRDHGFGVLAQGEGVAVGELVHLTGGVAAQIGPQCERFVPVGGALLDLVRRARRAPTV